MKRLLYIYNPYSGGESHTKQLDAIIKRFTENDIMCHLHRLYTQEPDTILDSLILSAPDTFDGVAIAGGDGTASSIINRLDCAGVTSLPVAIVPTGTCNDFARSIGMPTDPMECVDIICRFKTVSIDLGIIKTGDGATQKTNCFINSIATGVLAGIAYNTQSDLKKRFGPLAYYFAVLGEIGAIKPFDFRIDTESESTGGQALIVMVLNGRDVGGMNNIIGHADMSDGQMNILIARDCNNIEKAAAFLNLLAGKPDPNLVFLQCERCLFTADAGIGITIDGEEGAPLPYDLSMKRGAINVICDLDAVQP